MWANEPAKDWWKKINHIQKKSFILSHSHLSLVYFLQVQCWWTVLHPPLPYFFPPFPAAICLAPCFIMLQQIFPSWPVFLRSRVVDSCSTSWCPHSFWTCISWYHFETDMCKVCRVHCSVQAEALQPVQRHLNQIPTSSPVQSPNICRLLFPWSLCCADKL